MFITGFIGLLRKKKFNLNGNKEKYMYFLSRLKKFWWPLPTVTFSQPDKPALTKQDYLKKSKNQKITSFILVGGGIGLWLAGASKYMNQTDNIDGGGEAAMVIGGVAVLTSIPFFIASSKNKKKAAALSLRLERSPAIQLQNQVYHHYPSVSLSIVINWPSTPFNTFQKPCAATQMYGQQDSDEYSFLLLLPD